MPLDHCDRYSFRALQNIHILVLSRVIVLTSHPGQLSLAIPPCRRNKYHSKSGDALRLGSKGRYGSCV